MLVNHLEVHEQVSRKVLGLEITTQWSDLDLFPHVGANGLQQTPVGMRRTLKPAIDKTDGIVWQGHTMATHFLRQRLQSPMCFFLEHAWHQPLTAQGDRKRVVSGKSVSVRVDLGGRRNIKKKKQKNH